MMFALIVGFLFLAAIGGLLVRFAYAEGDYTLLSKGRAKREIVEGKVVWITGASRGIGELLAEQFAGLGAKLIISSRNIAELERVKLEIIGKHPGTSIEILPLDLASDEESLKDAVQKAESLFCGSGVNFMVHNAAFERPKRKALEETEEGLQATFKVNVLGTLTLTKLLAPFYAPKGGGHFTLMSSAAGKCPAPGQAIYAASKHALNGYFHTFSERYNSIGI
ncbi:hypothetical protein HPP92_026202 [Vanilla planifolia]|uniref:Ketoreductase domain-containing protein n=1 Tax=Vanilla planifolia TaxID=51239 RepID=A0A835RIH9_VANPL|nr:hypothetical protein HPP92_026202 [Vanilla planifolia]KAG0488790.1 hypothetical protein HPP92_007601 [Vanilla planifolia]